MLKVLKSSRGDAGTASAVPAPHAAGPLPCAVGGHELVLLVRPKICVRATSVVLFCLIFGLLPRAWAGHTSETEATCAGVVIAAIAEPGESLAAVQAAIGASADPSISIASAAEQKDSTALILLGPALGSMDSREVETRVQCGGDSISVVAIITRSAGYKGATLQNVLWRPKITVRMAPGGRAVLLRSVWRMRRSDGVEVGRAQTPPYHAYRYPVVVLKQLGIGGRAN